MKTINEKPTAKVAIKKNMLKQYVVDGVETVFMANGTEFELELFNPTQETIMCEITLNGKEEKDGIVLYPGQRVFLERYLEDKKKFKFITYDVDATDSKALQAIVNNGKIKVAFYKEIERPTLTYTTWVTPTTWVTSPCIYNSTTNNYYSGMSTDMNLCGEPIGVMTTSGGFAATSASGNFECSANFLETPKELMQETGIIGKGKESKQQFSMVTNEFAQFAFHTAHIKILPDSQKLLGVNDLKYKKYCSKCGKKVNHNDKYCSYCGNKL